MASDRSLEHTPTWAVAAVCFVFIAISIVIEEMIRHIGLWLTKRKKKALNEALEKIKAELMLLGFISLLLTVGQSRVAKICISDSLSDTMLPCKLKNTTEDSSEGSRKRLLESFSSHAPERRVLAAATAGNPCTDESEIFPSIDMRPRSTEGYGN